MRASGSWLTLSELLKFGTRTVDVISYLPVCVCVCVHMEIKIMNMEEATSQSSGVLLCGHHHL